MAAALLLVAACRGRPVALANQVDLPTLVDSLRPAVEKATGLTFTEVPKSSMISRDDVTRYLKRQVLRELPPARRAGLEAAYRLLGFLPDSLNLESVLVGLYTEQVAGYYDPETKTLYGVEGADPAQLRLVFAHELVHALQGQHLPLDSLMRDSIADSDVRSARQAVFEGQATLASIRVLAPTADVLTDDSFWELYHEQIDSGQQKMAAFRDAPQVLKTGLIFPYLQGAEFMRWWVRGHGLTTQPYGTEMPRSTEQILHPERLAAGDAPVALRFGASTDTLLLEDAVGEVELRLMSDMLVHTQLQKSPLPLVWGGDRFRVVRTSGGPALDWVVVFDEPRFAERFRPVLEALVHVPRAGYIQDVRPVSEGGKAGFRVVIAPAAWVGRSHLPAVEAPVAR